MVLVKDFLTALLNIFHHFLKNFAMELIDWKVSGYSRKEKARNFSVRHRENVIFAHEKKIKNVFVKFQK